MSLNTEGTSWAKSSKETPEFHSAVIQKILTFLGEIGLVCHISPGASGFTKGVEIREGELFVDPEAVSASTLLHEAGHLAIIPTYYRGWMNGNFYKSFKAIFDDVAIKTNDPDHPVLRAVIQSTDTETTAWAWAAGIHLGLPKGLIIAPEDYDNEGDDIAMMLSVGHYAGINGLTCAGFTQHNRFAAERKGEPLFPKMKQWVQSASW